MANTSYTTVNGDTFDMMALDMYSDEFKAHHIIQANPNYAHIITFNAGVRIQIPKIEADVPSTLPPWKR